MKWGRVRTRQIDDPVRNFGTDTSRRTGCTAFLRLPTAASPIFSQPWVITIAV